MKYQINKTNYCTFNIFQDNKLPGRSYFIPYPNKEECDEVSLLDKRYKSSKVICLNGDWDFKFYPYPKDLPDVLDTDNVNFDKIDVPSCWQCRGYYHPFYVNVRYPFPLKPPYIPEEDEVGKCFSWLGFDQGISAKIRKPKDEYNFVGVYRHTFDIQDNKKNHIISFLGVTSCLDLYINGQYVGYSEGSHNTAEFDISKYLNNGKNELLAVVHRWCNGSYLEDQDMFRNNGIFRDVLLRVNEKDDIYDIDIRTHKINDRYNLFVKSETFNDTEVKVIFEGHDIKLKKSVKTYNKVAEITFDDLEVKEWTAESPNLYNIYIITTTSCIKESIGFKDIKIIEDKLYLNDRLFKVHGVNHHDTGPKNGYYMTPKEIEKDILICKEYNIDTIRTSHYPPDPLLIELADLYGLYIIDENDLETHGCFANQFPPNFNTISHNKKWEAHYIDRISRLYQRDKIHANTSIIMWSLGNEAGGYYNTDRMYEYLKAHSSLPVHYESSIHSRRIAYDVGSEMYPSVRNVALVGQHKRKQKPLNDRPYIMCEYAHAMGVGPGDVETYWEQIYKYDNIIGGCVWEMVDHAILHEDGSYTYGGDHHEWEHDGNFCVDGLFYPDRTPSTGAHIIKFIYRPIRIRHLHDDVFEIFNTLAFTSSNEYELDIAFNDGSHHKYIFDISPLTKKEVNISLGKEVDNNLSLIVTTYKKGEDKVIAKEQIIIKKHIKDLISNKPLPDCFKATNAKVEIKIGEDKLLSNDEYNLLYRAKTDNDSDYFFTNKMKPYYDQKEIYLSSKNIDNGIEIKTKVTNKRGKYLVTDRYQGHDEGIIVTSTIESISAKGYLPRFGKCFYLPSSYDDVEYVARSGETYADMVDQFTIGHNKCHVLDMTEPNIKPQESGNRMDCSFVSVSNDKHKVSFIALNDMFELGIKPYTDRALIQMKHNKDEIRTGTYVTIQAFQQGIGTGACGPYIAKKYLYKANKKYTVKFLIKIS